MKEVDSVLETFEDHVVEGSSHEKPSTSPLFSKNLREYRWRVVRLFTFFLKIFSFAQQPPLTGCIIYATLSLLLWVLRFLLVDKLRLSYWMALGSSDGTCFLPKCFAHHRLDS